jgi:hypothetical protein
MTGPIGYDETVSFSNWDIFWYTRGFPSVDDDRAGRQLSKLLTYPLSIAGVIHEHSSLTTRNQRLTPEGLRSLVGEQAVREIIRTSITNATGMSQRYEQVFTCRSVHRKPTTRRSIARQSASSFSALAPNRRSRTTYGTSFVFSSLRPTFK